VPSPEHDKLFEQLGGSLRNSHPSMQCDHNPVLRGLITGKMTGHAGLAAIAQYAFLPSRIVGILTAMSRRLKVWPEVHKELERNVEEETGTKTDGEAHFSILRRCLQAELGLKFDPSNIQPLTSRFLDALDEAIATRPAAFVAGMAYALEDSALPELEIVAYCINAAWQAAGHPQLLIAPDRLNSKVHCKAIQDHKSSAEYTLEDFFVVHLQDFEVGHEAGLRLTVASYLKTPADSEVFEQGFEFTLNLMDAWWDEMARIS
jgi:hypothetical protein